MSRRDARVAARFLSADDAQRVAKRRLPRIVYRYLEGGREDEITSRGNRPAFRRITFRPRAGVSVPARDLSTTVLGTELAMPVVLAPAGFQRLAHPDGEIAAARAAGEAGVGICVSTMASYSIADIAQATSGPVWYQLYFAGDRDAVEAAIAEAGRAGCTALVVTMDTAAVVGREQYLRHTVVPAHIGWREMFRFGGQMLAHPGWCVGFLRGGRSLEVPNVRGPDGGPMSVPEAAASLPRYPTPAWDDFAWIRDLWSGPIVAKGILTAESARCAVGAGADAIVVSNHGGNVLDGTPPSIDVLAEIVDAVGSETEVLLDSGIRRGSDIAKALALGARAVLVGRAYLWALAAAGEPGIARLLELLRTDLDRTLALLGCSRIGELDPSYVRLSGARS